MCFFLFDHIGRSLYFISKDGLNSPRILTPEPVIIAMSGISLNFFKSKSAVSLYKKFSLIFLIFIFFICSCSLSDAKNGRKIGVLYSYANVDFYKTNNILSFYQAWKPFCETFQKTYLNYQFLCNFSEGTRIEDINVDVIFFPLALDISSEEIQFLEKFLSSGGKVVVTAGVGTVSQRLKDFLSSHGIIVTENIIARSNLNSKHKIRKTYVHVPSGNFYSMFEIQGPEKKILARWKEGDQIAVGGTNEIAYIGYSWGQDVNRDDDVMVFLGALDFFWRDITTSLAKEINEEEYKKILREINIIQKEASSVINVSEQLDLPVPKYQLKRHYEDGQNFINEFNSDYLFGNYLSARENAESAKSEFSIVYALGVPLKNVEIRALWLDRGTIVAMKDPGELANYIKDLARAGFNVILFETINAGYSIYPSEHLKQNPLINGWDPLKVAVEAAHSSGVELHAWVWTFAVGNSRHNLLVGQDVSYPGPIISEKGKNWTLTDKNGGLRIEMQPETWISPANPEACNFLKAVFSEIVSKYEVDGLQFDYIRFPFQKKHTQVGYDLPTKTAFKAASGKFPAEEGTINKIWIEWKAKIVSDFVRDTSAELRKIRPGIKISTAVFGIERSLRLRTINQDWENWLLNKWIDAAYPFYYSYTGNEIQTKINAEKEAVNYSGIIVPAYNLRTLSIGDLAERITQSRNSGVLGFALFAAEHLSFEKKNLLKTGPFRDKAEYIPYNHPLVSSQKLLDEFSVIIDKFAAGKNQSVLSSSETQKEVYSLTNELNNDFKSFSFEKIPDIEKKLVSLQLKVKDWLSLEKYLDRNQRALYISTYLDQIRTLVNYMKPK